MIQFFRKILKKKNLHLLDVGNKVALCNTTKGLAEVIHVQWSHPQPISPKMHAQRRRQTASNVAPTRIQKICNIL